jgi:hypothetical protein
MREATPCAIYSGNLRSLLTMAILLGTVPGERDREKTNDSAQHRDSDRMHDKPCHQSDDQERDSCPGPQAYQPGRDSAP